MKILEDIVNLIKRYPVVDIFEKIIKQSIIDLVFERKQKCISSKENIHITCSSFIFNNSFSRILLVYHDQLNCWIQPGGHIEMIDTTCQNTICREVSEETGLLVFNFR